MPLSRDLKSVVRKDVRVGFPVLGTTANLNDFTVGQRQTIAFYRMQQPKAGANETWEIPTVDTSLWLSHWSIRDSITFDYKLNQPIACASLFKFDYGFSADVEFTLRSTDLCHYHILRHFSIKQVDHI